MAQSLAAPNRYAPNECVARIGFYAPISFAAQNVSPKSSSRCFSNFIFPRISPDCCAAKVRPTDNSAKRKLT